MTAESRGEKSDAASSIRYRKLRSPKLDGTSLQVPPLRDVSEVWKSNLDRVAASGERDIAGLSLSEIRALGRCELIQLAKDYSSKYLDFDFVARSTGSVILAGHQPELFHPGVWYKNFALSKLGRQFNCLAINLIVDNDICGNASIRFPKLASTRDGQSSFDWKQVSVGTIPVASPGPNVPFEVRAVDDLEFFQSFSQRANASIKPLVGQPIVNRLWPEVLSAGQAVSSSSKLNLGASIAAGRHRLESKNALETLEVPLSLVSGTNAFARFAFSILGDLERFRAVYNETLIEYRTVHRIRSRSHPVPELDSVDGWLEAPFWIWKVDQPKRQRLFVRRTGNRIELTDRAGWLERFDETSFVDQFPQLMTQSGIAIRPKALMTTLFSRLVLSDLFLHGIGGSKYDQLTDVISEKFFQVSLPDYYTLSATMKLPFDGQLIGRHDVISIEQQIRQLRFHPETRIKTPSEAASALMAKKKSLIQAHSANCWSRQNHDAIVVVNQLLSELVDEDAGQLTKIRLGYLEQLRASEILGSREYSFCLFNEDVISKLKVLCGE